MVDLEPVSKRQIVVLSDVGPEAWWRKSILRRHDFNVMPVKDFRAALEVLRRVPCDLLIVEHMDGDPAISGFLREVKDAFPLAPFKFILLSAYLPHGRPPEPVTQLVRLPCTPDQFDSCIAVALGIPPRSSRRYLLRIRLGYQGDPNALQGLAASVELNAGGMLVECSNHLTPGQKLTWSFVGVKELQGLSIPGAVLREEMPRKGNLRHYVVAFDSTAVQPRKVLADYLNQMF